MIPDSAVGLVVVILAVLPGSVFTWAFERQNGAYGVTATDRILRFVSLSMMFHLLLAWPEYLVYRTAVAGHDRFASGEFAAVWAGALLLFAIPAVCGTVIGGLYATRTARSGWGWVRKLLTAGAEDRVLSLLLGRAPAPRAWDYFFSERPNVYLRVQVDGGGWLAGRFASASYAGGFPNDGDLYLEEAWSVDPDTGVLGDAGLGYPLYIPGPTIKWVDVIDDQPVSSKRES